MDVSIDFGAPVLGVPAIRAPPIVGSSHMSQGQNSELLVRGLVMLGLHMSFDHGRCKPKGHGFHVYIYICIEGLLWGP